MAKKILIVDDEAAIRVVLQSLLQEEGYEVFANRTGEEALATATEHEIDGFLLDVELQGMSGLELCRALRTMDRYRLTPIMFVTGNDDSGVLENGFRAGCNDFLIKPVQTSILRARLKGHLERMEYFSQLEKVRRNLARYVSNRTKAIVESYSRTGELPSPKESEVCICFTDIRGFTALSEEMESQALFSILSKYLAEQVELVYQFGGYIDKFGGDGVMAIFDGPDMAVRACLCALRVLDSARRLAEGTDQRIHQTGIGIHMGRVVIGNIGSSEHFDYSVIGRSVNLAARLCGVAAPMTAVVSDAVRDAAREDPRLLFHDLQQVSIRGFRQPVSVYRLSAQNPDAVGGT
jgi:class 3 adenylate cyclase